MLRINRFTSRQSLGVPEYKVGVTSSLTGVDFIGSIVLGQGDLHELGGVQGEGEDCHGHNVDQQSLTVAHRLKNKVKDIFVWILLETRIINNEYKFDMTLGF